MANARYSKLEIESPGERDLEYTPRTQRSRLLSIFSSLWLIITTAFCVGMLAMLGVFKLYDYIENRPEIDERETDFLSIFPIPQRHLHYLGL